MGISNSSYSLAVNTYFKEKRHKAVALTLTIAGLGPIIMPQLMNFFMNEYSIKGVSLILSGICAHCFVAATLLQPVKYHLKKTEVKPKPQLERIVEEDEDKESGHEEEIDDAVFTLPMTSPRFNYHRSSKRNILHFIQLKFSKCNISSLSKTIIRFQHKFEYSKKFKNYKSTEKIVTEFCFLN